MTTTLVAITTTFVAMTATFVAMTDHFKDLRINSPLQDGPFTKVKVSAISVVVILITTPTYALQETFLVGIVNAMVTLH